jgi:hypothetical protein
MDGGCITNSSLLFCLSFHLCPREVFFALCQLASIYKTPGIGFTQSQLCTSAWVGLVWLGLAGKTKKNVAFDVLGFLSGCFVVLSVWGVDGGGKYQVLFCFHLSKLWSSSSQIVNWYLLSICLPPTLSCLAFARNSPGSAQWPASVGLRLFANYGDVIIKNSRGNSMRPVTRHNHPLILSSCFSWRGLLFSCLFPSPLSNGLSRFPLYVFSDPLSVC